MRGRTIMVYDRPDGELVQVFQVGPEETVEALVVAHPELRARHIVVDGIIDWTSAAFMELERGESGVPRSPIRRQVTAARPRVTGDRRRRAADYGSIAMTQFRHSLMAGRRPCRWRRTEDPASNSRYSFRGA